MNSLNDKVRMFVKPTTRDGKMSMVYGDTWYLNGLKKRYGNKAVELELKKFYQN